MADATTLDPDTEAQFDAFLSDSASPTATPGAEAPQQSSVDKFLGVSFEPQTPELDKANAEIPTEPSRSFYERSFTPEFRKWVSETPGVQALGAVAQMPATIKSAVVQAWNDPESWKKFDEIDAHWRQQAGLPSREVSARFGHMLGLGPDDLDYQWRRLTTEPILPNWMFAAERKAGEGLQAAGAAIEPSGPLSPVRRMLEGYGGVLTGGAKSVQEMTTPFNVLAAVAVPEGLPTKLLAGYFEGRALYGTPEQWRRLRAAPTMGEQSSIATEMLMSHLPALGLLGGKGAEPPSGPPLTRPQPPGLEPIYLQPEDLPPPPAGGPPVYTGPARPAPAAPAVETTLPTEGAPGAVIQPTQPLLLEGGEPSAIEPSHAQVETRETPLGVETRPESEVTPPSDSDNVVRETEGATAGREIPSQVSPAAEAAGIDLGTNKNLPEWAREQMISEGKDPGRIFNDVDLGNPSIRNAIEIDPTLTRAQKDHLLRTGELLPIDEEAAPTTETSATTEPTTRETPSREEIGDREAQPAPPPGVGEPFQSGNKLYQVAKVTPRKTASGRPGGFWVHLKDYAAAKGGKIKKVVKWPMAARRARTIRVAADDFGDAELSPVASYVMESGGIISKTQAQKKGIYAGNEASWDDRPSLQHVTHNKIWRPTGERPDVMASNLHSEGLISDPYVATMYKALEDESRSARSRAETSKAERREVTKVEKQQADYQKAQAAEKKAGSEAHQLADLQIGDKITVGDQVIEATNFDPDSMTMEMTDGSKFGVMHMTGDEVIFGELESAGLPEPGPEDVVPSVDALRYWNDHEIKDRISELQQHLPGITHEAIKSHYAKELNVLKEEQARRTEVAKPAKPAKGKEPKTVKPGQELIPAKEMPFSLAGEEPPSGELTKEGAARAEAERAALEKKQQPDLFGEAKRLRMRGDKEGGYVNPDVMRDVVDFAKRVYRRGMSYAQWAGQMLRHLGEKIRDHLLNIWRGMVDLRGGRTLPQARERGAVPLPTGPKRGMTESGRQLAEFRKQARAVGVDPHDPVIFEYWKAHLESLPHQGESFKEHAARTPEITVSRASYEQAQNQGQLMLAQQIKTAAYRRGLDLGTAPVTRVGAAPRATRTPTRVYETPENELHVRMPVGKEGKLSTQEFVVPPERIPSLISEHIAAGHEILGAPKGSLEKAGKIAIERRNTPTVAPSDWSPEEDDPVGDLNNENGGTTTPPPGSAFQPPGPPGGGNTPGTGDPGHFWFDNMGQKINSYWKWFWPRDRAMLAEDERRGDQTGAHLLNSTQRWLENYRNIYKDALDSSAYAKLQNFKHEENFIVDAEDQVVTFYRAFLDAGVHPEEAWSMAVRGSPLEDPFTWRQDQEPHEEDAANRLGVQRPRRIDDPYLARLTDHESNDIVELGYSSRGILNQVRSSIGVFDKTRTKATMKAGIADGVAYRPVLEAWLQREKVGALLRASADFVDDLRAGGVLHDSVREAMDASYDGKTAIKIEGLGGRDYYVHSKEQAQFLEHNFSNTANPKNIFSKWGHFLNLYIRNPELVNPLPHITKNMLFKYILARINNIQLWRDIKEFRDMSSPQDYQDFKELGGVPESHLRAPQLTARGLEGTSLVRQFAPEGTLRRKAQESALWANRVSNKLLRVNEFSQKYIFQKADPAMRYSLWKSYLRQGMSKEQAMGHVWLDLVRYDANSGGMTIWKSIPFNFFVPWRVGTYVTLFKAMRAHPIRTLMFIGAVEYMREAIYRHTMKWTHLPVDYLEAPLAEALNTWDEQKRLMAMGKSPQAAVLSTATDAGKILGLTALFGPGGAQAPDTIAKFMEAIRGGGSPAERARAMNMFWGLAQLYNIPKEMYAYTKDGNNQHLVNVVTNAAFGTHDAIKYEPRRLGKYLPEWLPGMTKSEEYKAAESLREKRETKAAKAETTFEQRQSVSRGFYQGDAESQWQALYRASGIRPQRPGAPPTVSRPSRPGRPIAVPP